MVRPFEEESRGSGASPSVYLALPLQWISLGDFHESPGHRSPSLLPLSQEQSRELWLVIFDLNSPSIVINFPFKLGLSIYEARRWWVPEFVVFFDYHEVVLNICSITLRQLEVSVRLAVVICSVLVFVRRGVDDVVADSSFGHIGMK